MAKQTGFAGSVKYKVLFILLLGFGTLAALIALLWFSAVRKAEQIYLDAASRESAYRQLVSSLHSIQNDIFLSGIVLRDFLLDEPPLLKDYRQETQRIKSSLDSRLREMDPLLPARDHELLARLRLQVAEFWRMRESIFDWNPEQKRVLSRDFVERNLVPQRDAILAITGEMTRLRADGFEQEQAGIARRWAEFGSYLSRLFSIALLLAGIVAAISIFRILRLERDSERVEETLRRLSQQLVQTQEEERKAISRELHDEIGQMLTALRLELGHMDKVPQSGGSDLWLHVGVAKGLAESLFHSVRSLARGLRPTMLDHLGLGPALQSQAREFSARTQIQATVQLDPDLPDLSESFRICIFRIVQESLTNCARHSKAGKVCVTVRRTGFEIFVSIEDDGIGFDPATNLGHGLGLIGMKERAKNLGGTMSMRCEPRSGTRLEFRLPWSPADISGEGAVSQSTIGAQPSAELLEPPEISKVTALRRV